MNRARGSLERASEGAPARAPSRDTTPAERFAAGMANPLRAAVMYPPDRRLFLPFRNDGKHEQVSASLADAEGPIVLYAHVPFCETKCSFCDYETVPLARHDAASIDGYVDALARELETIAASLPSGTLVSGFDVGGGTPGVLSAAQFERLLATVDRCFRTGGDFEVSTETTPTLAAADPAKWRAIASAGVGRVSMGIQTDDDALLGRLNRAPHAADRVRAGFEVLREAGFAMVNVDLMFALPGLSLERWERTLRTAIELAPDVVTVYDTVWKNRGIANRARPTGAFPTVDEYGAQYDAAFEWLTGAGYRSRYGSVNFSRVPGRLGTSRYLEGRILDGRDYAGAGLYASSLVRDSWHFNRRKYADWLAQASSGKLAAEDLYLLPAGHVMAKYVLLALSYGYLDAARFRHRFGVPLEERFPDELRFLEDAFLLERAPDGWQLSPRSFSRLPGIRAVFYPDDAIRTLDLPL